MVQVAPAPLIIPCLVVWRHHPAAPSPSGDMVKPFLLLLLLLLALPWASATSLWRPQDLVSCPSGAGERSLCQDHGCSGSVSALGGRWQLIWQLPSHSCSWPPQGQNPFDLEFNQSSHLEPVFNFECPPRPGEPWVPGAAPGVSSHPNPCMLALCAPPKALGGCAGW